MSYGMAGYLGLAKEVTWGTPVSPASFMELMSENIALSIDRFDTRNIFNSLAEPDDTPGMQRVEGDIVAPGNPEYAGHLLAMGLGQVASSSISATLWRHVFQARATDVSSLTPLQPYTLEVFRDVTSAQQYAGSVCRQLSIQAQPNQDLRFTASVIGRSMVNKARVAAAAVLFPTTPGQPFTFDTCSISIAGAATDLIEGFTININNQLETVAAFNASDKVARIQRTGPVMVSLQGNLSFTNIDQLLDFQNQTERAFAFNFVKAASFSLLINLPRVVYTTYPTATQGRGRITIGFEGKARVPVGSTSQIVATLVNQSLAY